ncbi:MAG: DMT family transporter [Candidatus Curtissbacteria bacterium]|nr:DMT family transporter [Candidatus Curtissbacteria bacterium]
MKIKPAYVLIITSVLIWGATPAIMKLTLAQIPVFSLAFLRMAIASLIMAPLITKQIKFKKEDFLMFFLSAFFGVTLNLSFFFIGLKLSFAINAALLIAAVPIFALLAGHIYLKEKLTSKIILASVLALAGVVIIIGRPTPGSTLTHFIGNILLLLASLAVVAQELVAKKLFRKYSGETVAFHTMAIGAATFAPLALWEYFANPTWFQGVNLVGVSGLIYGILFASLIAYWAWLKGLSKLPLGEASFFFYLDPITGVALAVVLLGEKLTPTLILGGILIAIGVFLAEQKRRNHPLLKDAVN